MSLRIAMGSALMAVKGQTAPEVMALYEAAYSLCQDVSDQENMFPALLGLWRFYGGRGDLAKAHELAKQLMRIADASNQAQYRLEAHMAMGNSLFFMADFTQALTHFEHGITIYQARSSQPPNASTIRDPGVVCYSIAALALWKLGFPDQALRRCQAAIALARDLNHPMSRAFAAYQTGMLHQFRREPREVLTHAAEALQLATENELGPWICGQAMVLQGWAKVYLHDGEAGIAEMWRGMEMLASIEAKMPWPLCQLADGYRHMNQPHEALRVLERSSLWTPVEAPCVDRLRGELGLILETSNLSEAESHFLAARERFRQQGARSDELRVAMGLYRLRRRQGHHQVAHDLLMAVYRSFTEGFDTPDLTEARGLLFAGGEPVEASLSPVGT